MEKITILNNEIYESIVSFIANFDGLSINCKSELLKRFSNVEEQTLTSILCSENNQLIKVNYHRYQSEIKNYLIRFEEISRKDPNNPEIIVELGKQLKIPPNLLSRLLIYEKYKELPKSQLTEMLKHPYIIPDKNLGNNVRVAVFSDNQEGPIMDIIRRCLGEEYEVKLKSFANEVGMHYLDENDLRRTGFDKTPDLKLAVPVLYKGSVVNWIESKALFGDIKIHKRYIKQQFDSYLNRFGSGIVIYWFGYLEDILRLKENGDGLMILSHLPEKEHLEFLKFDIKL